MDQKDKLTTILGELESEEELNSNAFNKGIL